MFGDDEDDEPFKAEAMCLGATEKALQVRIRLPAGNRTMWVPKSVVHDDSEVFDAKDNARGKLVLQAWFAREEGLVD